MNRKAKIQKTNQISPKTKYKLNVYRGGIIYADSVLELIYKIVTNKYIKNENPYMGKGRKPRKNTKLDSTVQQLNS
jgi:hypothetical protein